MNSENSQSDNFYSVEMDKAGEELLICYWCFDTLEEAQNFLNRLKNGCTALPITLSLYDAKQQLLEAWAVGDESQPSKQLTLK
ncbi:hypothetical protein [Phaeodactylibacter sp.]|uniref:hypothetical protein n=1 Tax=Phaeodactylibacter sp. TaxID=1940289 RepID=UPI0025E254A8|nr:hypothetical protein [Phaeodactylibacter sp.]MCI5092683.1 hypothetical protein [Phaeodactylibacter sp.]